MQKMEFKVLINTPAEKVWNILWGDESYPQWTSVFSESSRVETDWNEGSKALFLDGKGQGMVSIIAEKKQNQFMSFKHIGVVNNGVEELDSSKTKGWAGALENYTLKALEGKTELRVDIDTVEEYKDYFFETWPKALEKVKELAEQK
ncbi:MAG: SRPBCC domain-containing protein [Flavisolibacter sp.]|nr:SRPBCC domain-containing protein [Flavisolibacter sp.]